MQILPTLLDLFHNCQHYLTVYGGRDDLGAFEDISEPWIADASRCICLQRAELMGEPFLLITWNIEGSTTIQMYRWTTQ